MLRSTLVGVLYAWAAIHGTAAAQTAKDLVGTWLLVSNDRLGPDGSRTPLFGANPSGIVIFSNEGHFSYLFSRPDLPQIASVNRNGGTANEYKAIVQGTISAFGTYSVADKTITMKIEASTFPNAIGKDRTRQVVSFTRDDLKWIVTESGARGNTEAVFRRVR